MMLCLFFVVIVGFLFVRLKPHLPKSLFYPMYLYLIISYFMNCFAIFRNFSFPEKYRLITVVGTILFFVSDVCLFFVRFDKISKIKTHSPVMLTYSIGEFLIILGMIMRGLFVNNQKNILNIKVLE